MVSIVPDRAYYEREYDTRRTAPDREQVLQRRLQLSEQARATLPCQLDIPYAPGARQRLDIFPSDGPSMGVLLFIHGGYWQSLDKEGLAFLALALTKAHVTLVLVDYDLAPAVPMDEIVRQTRSAITWVWRNAPGYGWDRSRIHVGGISAGAHLAAMIAACDWRAFDATLPTSPVNGCIAVSGIYDLQPIRFTRHNDALALDAESAARNSPLLRTPTLGGSAFVAVGGLESHEFHRQANEFTAAWTPTAKPTFVAKDSHHSSILLELVDKDSLLFAAVMDCLEPAAGSGSRR